MNTITNQPDLQHLILLGGGHAQVTVLKDLAMRPIPGLRITLISRDILTPYSGMLPGYMEGYYQEKEITIDLSHLARVAGARFIHANVTAIDPDAKTVTISGRPPMHYDLLSVNIGSSPDVSVIPGAKDHATPIKPISTLLGRFDELVQRSDGKHIAIIGGGAAGVEVALSLHHRLKNNSDTKISLYHRGNRLVPEYPISASRRLLDIFKSRGIDVTLGKAVTYIGEDHIKLDDMTEHALDHTLVVTAGGAPSWLKDTGLALDQTGFIKVNSFLQSMSHDSVFASGDIAGLAFAPRPKAGVFAVRGGKPLAENIRRKLHGMPLVAWKPQQKYLALIGTGGGEAIPVRGNVSLPHSRLAWQLKEYIDRAFITKFSDLPKMATPAKPAIAAVLDGDDPALADMRCLGCGAKAGYGTLHDAIKDAAQITLDHYPDSTPFSDITSDSSEINLNGISVIQSVDAISALVDDPFLLGKISARHAMSDLFASNAKPLSAMAIITLPSALSALQQDDISQIMAGAMLALHEDGAKLTGGHTSEGETMQVGFAVTGIPADDKTPDPAEGNILILTKPLGTGIIMAGHGQGLQKADGHIRAEAIRTMATSNGIAARTLKEFGPLAMTDVTGFGLARHTLSLLSRGGDSLSASFSASALPLLAGVADLIADGVRSSLYPLNSKAAPVIMETDASDVIMHDPQTGGGLLVAMPANLAEDALKALIDNGVEAAPIGTITADGAHQIRVTA